MAHPSKIDLLFYLFLFLFGVIINNNISITFLLFIIIFCFSDILRKKFTGDIGNFLLFFLSFYLIYYLCYYLLLCLFGFIDFITPILAFIFIKQIIVIFSGSFIKFPFILKCLCFTALITA